MGAGKDAAVARFPIPQRRAPGGIPRRGHDGPDDPGDLQPPGLGRAQDRRVDVVPLGPHDDGGLLHGGAPIPAQPACASIRAMSASDRPTWWPISWTSTWVTRAPSVSSWSAQ